MISLARFSQQLRPYQQDAVDAALDLARGGRLMLALPTGAGKGSIQLGLMQALLERGDDAVIVTPSLEVLRGYLERCGATPEELAGSAESLARMGQLIRVTTPVRLRNQLRKPGVKAPEFLIADEAHHATTGNVSGGGLEALCPGATWVGFTATPFRMTPEDTQDLRAAWGEPRTILTIPQAVALGAWALPTWDVRPLVDDDDLDLVKGDLDADEAVLLAATPLAALVASLDLALPTAVTVPSVDAARALVAALAARSVPTRLVLGETTSAARAEAYGVVALGGTCLVSVKVLGEGVDMPWLRRWVDASPTLSPVAFLQKLGRITRPGAVQPEYVGTCRNLERHGYLLQGAMPRDAIRQAQMAFGGASTRGARAGLIKGVARLKPVELPLAGGVKGTMWVLWTPSAAGSSGHERCIMLDPTSERVVCASRTVSPNERDWKDRYGAWVLESEVPAKMSGFRASKLAGALTPAQASWWREAAWAYGLDSTCEPSRVQFFALPVLKGLGAALTHDGKPVVPAPKAPGVPAAVPVAGEPQSTPANAATAPAGPFAALVDGYYTVVDGDHHRTWRLLTQSEDARFAPGQRIVALLTGPDNAEDYRGLGQVDAGGNLKVWRKDEAQRPMVLRDLAAILGDAEGAGKAFALRTGSCWRCNKHLSTPESIEAGIGPVCADKVGAEWGRRPGPPTNVVESVEPDVELDLDRWMGSEDAVLVALGTKGSAA